MHMKKPRPRLFSLLILTLAFWGTVIPVANAYIDANSGSFIIQAVVGASLGAAFAVKMYWRRITGFFSGRKRVSDNEE